jgi:cell division transport system permease protein
MARNIWLTIVTIIILILALFSINMLVTVNVITKTAVDSIKDKIDINLYLKPNAEENKIMALKAEIGNFSQVKEISYISKGEALESFKTKHQGDPDILEALRQLGENPLTPTLIIKAKSIEQYDELITKLNKIESDIIESRNFAGHKLLLAKIDNLSRKVNKVGVFVSLIFVVISILVVYNAIKVAIYTHRREIGIMKLVGASNWFVKSPFLISSIIYSLIGVIITGAIFYAFLFVLQPYLETFFVGYGINIISYFNQNFLYIFGLEFLAAAFINILASFTAIGRYSRV